jgi:cytochrome b561
VRRGAGSLWSSSRRPANAFSLRTAGVFRSVPDPAVHDPVPYPAPLRRLHWLTSVLVLALLALGLIMTRASMRLETTVAVYQMHKSLGCLVLVLTLVRLVVRLRQGTPALAVQSVWRRGLAHGTHAALYAVLLAMPVLGWLQVSASPVPFPTVLFGVLEVPHLAALASLPYDARLGWYQLFARAHRWLGWAAGGLIVLHIVGALHRGSDGRRPLERMRG